jgi:tripartite-type tricarboxylate transporter receptor subunit TctC
MAFHRHLGRAFGGVILAFAATLAHAEYPDKQITFVVPFAAGSATDQLARSLGQEVGKATGKPVIIDNKPGASGFIGAEAVKSRARRLHRLHHDQHDACGQRTPVQETAVRPVKDYLRSPVCKGGQIMIVNLNVPAGGQFIALRRRAGQDQLRQRQFVIARGRRNVPANGRRRAVARAVQSNPLAINDLLGGQINMMITDMATGLPREGRQGRPLGVSTLSARRLHRISRRSARPG